MRDMDGDDHHRGAARGRPRRAHRPGGLRPLGADPLRRRGPAHAAPAVRQPGPRERQAGRQARGLRRGGPRGDRRPPAPERGRPGRLRRALRPRARPERERGPRIGLRPSRPRTDRAAAGRGHQRPAGRRRPAGGDLAARPRGRPPPADTHRTTTGDPRRTTLPRPPTKGISDSCSTRPSDRRARDRHRHRRVGRRRHPPLRRGRGRRRRAARRLARRPRRPVHGHHGPVGLGQVDAHAPARRPRPADGGQRPRRRARTSPR